MCAAKGARASSASSRTGSTGGAADSSAGNAAERYDKEHGCEDEDDDAVTSIAAEPAVANADVSAPCAAAVLRHEAGGRGAVRRTRPALPARCEGATVSEANRDSVCGSASASTYAPAGTRKCEFARDSTATCAGAALESAAGAAADGLALEPAEAGAGLSRRSVTATSTGGNRQPSASVASL